MPLAALCDPEGERIPEAAPRVIDAHVHVFPDELFQAIWRWFDEFAWPIRYRLSSQGVIDFLLERGIAHIVALHYAHRPAIAPGLNAFMATLLEKYPQLTGTATVFPGEDAARGILVDAFRMGLRGVKLHAHVQYFDLDGEEMLDIFETCSEYSQPLVMHVGRQPKNPHYAYQTDPFLLCNAEKLERVLISYPSLRICVPHLGADEFAAYHLLLNQYDNLWIDVAMGLADYLPLINPVPLEDMRMDRIMYGSDFPNIPYAWDRELKRLCSMGLPAESLERICWKNAAEFFTISMRV
ncbi:MAG: amidohydrolase family protein [Deltaproteobacteria bacterium]|nr:amidohydrolase family protein [Deltaproteobacteria bacterium]